MLGAGAIGSLYGAKLAATNDVTLIGRAAHVAAINSHGLQIEGIESQRVRIRATTAVEQIGPNALILLTTKVPGAPRHSRRSRRWCAMTRQSSVSKTASAANESRALPLVLAGPCCEASSNLARPSNLPASFST